MMPYFKFYLGYLKKWNDLYKISLCCINNRKMREYVIYLIYKSWNIYNFLNMYLLSSPALEELTYFKKKKSF